MQKSNTPYNSFLEGNATPFNMAMLFYLNLNELLRRRSEAYINGDTWTWYRALRSIYRTIIFKVPEEDKKTLDDIFNYVDNALSTLPPEELNNNYVSPREREIEKKLDLVDKKIMIILDKNKMIFPKIQNVKGMDKLFQQYGLKNE